MKSSVRHTNFRRASLSGTEVRHRLMLAMAADAQTMREQAMRVQQLRKEKERREGKKISQETAAHAIGISVRTYRTWESTGADWKPENLKALADYYKTTAEFIERGPAAEPSSTPDLAEALGNETQLDRIEGRLTKLQALMERLAGDEVVAAVQQALAQESQSAGAKRPKKAA